MKEDIRGVRGNADTHKCSFVANIVHLIAKNSTSRCRWLLESIPRLIWSISSLAVKTPSIDFAFFSTCSPMGDFDSSFLTSPSSTLVSLFTSLNGISWSWSRKKWWINNASEWVEDFWLSLNFAALSKLLSFRTMTGRNSDFNQTCLYFSTTPWVCYFDVELENYDLRFTKNYHQLEEEKNSQRNRFSTRQEIQKKFWIKGIERQWYIILC